MPVLQRSRGILNLQTAWRTNTPSLLRALEDVVKCRGFASSPCSADTFEVARRRDRDYIVSKDRAFETGPACLTVGGFWHKLFEVWQHACEMALFSKPRRPSSSLLRCSRSSC